MIRLRFLWNDCARRLREPFLRWTAAFAGAAVLWAVPSALEGAEQRLRVVSTATTITDMVAAVGGDRIELEGLMGPGVDPHLYRPSVSDLRKLHRADVVFYMGLFFEEQMDGMLKRRTRGGRTAIAVTDGIPREKLLPADDAPDLYDPHVWFDVSLWALCVPTVVEGLSAADPGGRGYYEERGRAFQRKLADLHEWAKEKTAELPEERRILVTSHDAYGYFGRAYGFQVVGLMGLSTSGEAGLADISRLVDFIREKQLPAIFVESTVSPRAIQRVSADSGAAIGGELFSDALGAKGEMRGGVDVGTYEGMIRYNLTTMVEALR